jgi:hypothetical protein
MVKVDFKSGAAVAGASIGGVGVVSVMVEGVED